MGKFKVGDVVQLTHEAACQYRSFGKMDYWVDGFFGMVFRGGSAVVSSVEPGRFWLNAGKFWVPPQDLILACPTVTQDKTNGDGAAAVVGTEHNPIRPAHYRVIGEYQVKDINKAILDSMLEEGFDITLDEAGWWQQAMQYLMRGHKKGGIEDYKKAIQAMQFVVDSMCERNSHGMEERNGN